MDTTWHPSTIDTAKSQIHNLILDLEFPIIYTTNYDPWLELAFEARGKPYHRPRQSFSEAAESSLFWGSRPTQRSLQEHF
jgi:hypothetical protein